MFIAVCITFRTPSPAHSDNAIPIPSASPLPRSGWTLLEISSPMTGKFASAELRSSLEFDVALEHDPQDGDQDEHQGEQGEEPVVRHQRREVARLVVTELLHDRVGERDPRPALMCSVHTMHDPLSGIHDASS